MELGALTNINELVGTGENELIEFKSSFNDEAQETVGAFANTNGGTVLIGISNNGSVVGIDIGKKTLEDIANRIQESTDPRIQPSISVVNYDDKSIVIISVNPIMLGPVSIRGRYFRRVGKTNQRMSHDEVMQRMKLSSGFSWDSYIEPTARLDDLNLDKISEFVTQVRNARRHPVPNNSANLDLLRKMKLIINDKPTRASLLLFCNDPEKYCGSAFLKLGRFRSLIHIVDDRQIHGTLIEQLDGAMGWFRERLETEFVITGKPQRDVIWEYPLDAVREAVINLLCHRDYTSLAHSQIRLYDDSLEFWNAGALPIGLTTNMLFSKHDSVPRNKLIASAFFYMGLIEQWGSGTTRIATELQDSGHPAPQFESEMWRFRLYFFRKPEIVIIKPPILELTERQQKVVEYIKQHGSITNTIFQDLAGISARTATRELKKLTDMGALIQEGTTGIGTNYRLK